MRKRASAAISGATINESEIRVTTRRARVRGCSGNSSSNRAESNPSPSGCAPTVAARSASTASRVPVTPDSAHWTFATKLKSRNGIVSEPTYVLPDGF
jgi:hypothetical protein